MKMKKIAAAVMMVSMVAVTAVGCGSSNGTDTKGADANQSDATSDWDETSDVTIVSREDGSGTCLLYTSPSPRDSTPSRMPSSA